MPYDDNTPSSKGTVMLTKLDPVMKMFLGFFVVFMIASILKRHG